MNDIDRYQPDIVDQAGSQLPAGGALQETTDGKYTTAIRVQQPREFPVVQDRVNREVRLLGESAFYGWGAAGQQIEGPSIKLAMVLQRNWGNCAVAMEAVQDLPDAWVFTAVFVDLETGSTLTRQFRQAKKSIVHGKHDEIRKDDMRFQIGQSKAVRNVVLNALPAWLIDKAMEVAKEGAREKLEGYILQHGVEAARGIVLGNLKEFEVTEAQVIAKMGRKAAVGLTVDDLVTLRGDIQALKDKTETPDTLFGGEPSQTLRQKLTAEAPAKEPDAAPEPPTEQPPKAAVRRPQNVELRARVEALFNDTAIPPDAITAVLAKDEFGDIGEALGASKAKLQQMELALTQARAAASSPGQQEFSESAAK